MGKLQPGLPLNDRTNYWPRSWHCWNCSSDDKPAPVEAAGLPIRSPAAAPLGARMKPDTNRYKDNMKNIEARSHNHRSTHIRNTDTHKPRKPLSLKIIRFRIPNPSHPSPHHDSRHDNHPNHLRGHPSRHGRPNIRKPAPKPTRLPSLLPKSASSYHLFTLDESASVLFVLNLTRFEYAANF